MASPRKKWSADKGVSMYSNGCIYMVSADILPKGKTLDDVELKDLKDAGMKPVKDPNTIGMYRIMKPDEDAIAW